MEYNVGIALLLTAGAGLSTTIGSLLGLAVRKPGPRFMGFTLGFSAGVMLYVSFVEIFLKGVDALTEAYGDYWSHWINAASFFSGIALIGL